jgi:hypothetical protein
MYWEVVRTRLPRTSKEITAPWVDVEMTPAGCSKLTSIDEGTEEALDPGEDYVLKENLNPGYVAYPDTPSTANFRHTWVMHHRKRPKCPAFHGAPVPKRLPGEEERSARLTMTYFHPWTQRAETPMGMYLTLACYDLWAQNGKRRWANGFRDT